MNRLFLVGGTAVLLLFLVLPALATQAQTAAPTPTIDRLAAPPTVVAPTQADEGAQLYWLHCQPCHGDVGQGLSDDPDDDWRAQYPEEDQYCWNSGCHGARPYEEGFTLPKQVPAIIGESTLSRFATVADLYLYVQAAMPRQAPATLADEEYLAIVAHLVKGRVGQNGAELSAQTAQSIVLNTPEPPVAGPTAPPLATAVPPASPTTDPFGEGVLWLIGAGLLVLVITGGFLWIRQTR